MCEQLLLFCNLMLQVSLWWEIPIKKQLLLFKFWLLIWAVVLRDNLLFLTGYRWNYLNLNIFLTFLSHSLLSNFKEVIIFSLAYSLLCYLAWIWMECCFQTRVKFWCHLEERESMLKLQFSELSSSQCAKMQSAL